LLRHGKRQLFSSRSQGGGCTLEEDWNNGVMSSAKILDARVAVQRD
jgi:hypothetical protein